MVNKMIQNGTNTGRNRNAEGDATRDEGSKAFNGTIRDILYNACLIARSEGLLMTVVYACLPCAATVSISFHQFPCMCGIVNLQGQYDAV